MNNLRTLRKSAGISQKALADIFSVAQNTISQWELGIRDIDNGKLQALSAYFNCSIDYLLGNDPPASSARQDDEVWELRREMAEREEMRTLFSLSKNATKKDLELVNEMLRRMQGNADE